MPGGPVKRTKRSGDGPRMGKGGGAGAKGRPFASRKAPRVTTRRSRGKVQAGRRVMDVPKKDTESGERGGAFFTRLPFRARRRRRSITRFLLPPLSPEKATRGVEKHA